MPLPLPLPPLPFDEFPQLAGCSGVLAVGGGLSGAGIWRVSTPQGLFCLRRWPPDQASPERLRFVARLLEHGYGQGLTFLPVPLPATSGEPLVWHDGQLWQLAPWLPGRADFRTRPTAVRLVAACQALARFHVACASFRGMSDGSPTAPLAPRQGARAPSPGLVERARRLAALAEPGGVDRLVTLARQGPWAPLLVPLAEPLCDVVAAQRALVAWGATQQVPLQPVLRDPWHAHFLFTNDEVTGIVDFGAVQIDCVAADLARALGSLVADDIPAWQIALAAYEQVRPLEPAERDLIAPFDASGTLLAAVNWIEWLHGDGRQFADHALVRGRLEELAPRLVYLARSGSPGQQVGPRPKLWLPSENA